MDLNVSNLLPPCVDKICEKQHTEQYAKTNGGYGVDTAENKSCNYLQRTVVNSVAQVTRRPGSSNKRFRSWLRTI